MGISRAKTRGDIQALRAVAVLAVVTCHMNSAWLPGGYLGVDVFFVISGFVITQLLLVKQQNIQLGSFWLQRLFRILPAYAVMLAVVAPLGAMTFLPENFSQFYRSWQKSLLFTSNQYFAGYGDYFSPAFKEQPLLHTWSLAVEMQFYLAYPLFMLIALKLRAPWMLLAATAASFIYAQSSWMQTNTHTALYYALTIRVPEFLLGGMLSVYQHKLTTSWRIRFGLSTVLSGFLILFFALSQISEQRFSPMTSLIPCVGAALVIAGRVEVGFLSALYCHKVVVYLGALSYSVYLWHWPVLAFARYIYGDIQWEFLSILAYAVLVLCLGWMSWQFIEKNFNLKTLQSKFAIVKKLIIMFLVAVSPYVYADQVNALIPPLAIEFTRYADDAAICHGKMVDNCVRGVVSHPSFILIGDSHAAQLNLAADVAGNALGIGIEVITASSCVPLPGFNVKKLPEWAQEPCINQINVVSKKLATVRNILLAGMWSYQFQDETFPEVLNVFLKSAQTNGQRVWVMAQIPTLSSKSMRRIRLSEWGLNAPAKLDSDWKIANQNMAQILNNYPSIQFFDPSYSEMLSTPPFVKETLIYRDENHLNELGSKLYGILLINLLKTFVQQ